jgi:hypothetical protein
MAITLLKNHEQKKSKLFRTPFGISKKDNINIGKLVKTELISTKRSPYDSSFANQLANFRSNRSSTSYHCPFFSLQK